ncbi:RNA-directed DNA polymerase [Pectobacterium brasiliense]|nr:retron St85 family RNA-directed DNA polymerase [Pectobacterium brasiliense]MBN3066645.1 RNA-directed DNA polymerase [Pectobacterium brasiliense]MBN3246007.1 RNA-directed DNA polymerase [Pectobacterium brasiliense]
MNIMQLERKLCEKFELTPLRLSILSSKAPKKYRVYYIPKRNSGLRAIAQPTKELKDIQRFLISELEPYLPVHPSAMAYRKGVSIRDNAECHKNNPYLLKMDFQNFFNKIKPNVFFDKLNDFGFEYDYKDKIYLHNFLFWKPGQKRSITYVLSVGAPSSPFISNFVMFEFDMAVSKWCAEFNIIYTRYADDVTFSTSRRNILFSVPKMVKNMLAQYASGITINEAKTVFTSKAHNRHVTGVTITNDGKLSIGRKRKKHLFSLLFKYSMGELTKDEILYAKGLMSHCMHIEKNIIARLKMKYGSELINDFFKDGGDE